jgi:hypothetical protein
MGESVVSSAFDYVSITSFVAFLLDQGNREVQGA